MSVYEHPTLGPIELVPHPTLPGRSVGYWKGRAIVEVDTPEELETPPIGGMVLESDEDCTEDMTALSNDPT
jgi:hypothetical protein